MINTINNWFVTHKIMPSELSVISRQHCFKTIVLHCILTFKIMKLYYVSAFRFDAHKLDDVIIRVWNSGRTRKLRCQPFQSELRSSLVLKLFHRSHLFYIFTAVTFSLFCFTTGRIFTFLKVICNDCNKDLRKVLLFNLGLGVT